MVELVYTTDLKSVAHCELVGSSPTRSTYWPIAQLVEQLTVNQPVPGSNPGGPVAIAKVKVDRKFRRTGTTMALRTVSEVVITPPCHGGITGSNPVRSASNTHKHINV